MPDLHKALAEIDAIRTQVARGTEFRGYGPATVALTGLLALLASGIQALEVAPFGIQANVVAPNYLYSEMYYPKARFVDSAEGRDLIARTVPFGRLGQPEEVGALICFLASGKSPFTTGQVIHFTGGWS